MDNPLELITYEKIRHVKLFVNSITYRTFHTHNAFEFVCMLSSNQAFLSVQNEKTTLEQGDVYLINPYQPHEILSSKNSETTCLFLQFSRTFMQEYLPKLKICVALENNVTARLGDEARRRLWEMFFSLSDYYFGSPPVNTLSILIGILDLLRFLANHVPHKVLSEQQYFEHKKTAARITRIVEYIDKNYPFQIKLEDLAKQENLTANYISQFFTKNIGVPFYQYLNNVRLEAAVQLLQDSSLSVTQVSNYAGFSDAKYMSNVFRQKFGCTPREYRSSNIRLNLSADKKQSSSEYIHSPAEALEILRTARQQIFGR